MKRFTKVCLILAAVFLCIGLIFCVAGVSMNGKLLTNPMVHFPKIELPVL